MRRTISHHRASTKLCDATMTARHHETTKPRRDRDITSPRHHDATALWSMSSRTNLMRAHRAMVTRAQVRTHDMSRTPERSTTRTRLAILHRWHHRGRAPPSLQLRRGQSWHRRGAGFGDLLGNDSGHTGHEGTLCVGRAALDGAQLSGGASFSSSFFSCPPGTPIRIRSWGARTW